MYKQIYDGLIIETLCKYRDMSAQITSRIEQILQNMCSDEELMQVASMPGKSGEGNSNAEKFYDLSDVYEDFLKLKDKQAEEARLQIRELVERQETVNRIMTCYYVLPMEMQEVLEMLYISSETPKEGKMNYMDKYQCDLRTVERRRTNAMRMLKSIYITDWTKEELFSKEYR